CVGSRLGRYFRPFIDPALQQCQFIGRRTRASRRHSRNVWRAADRLDQQAFVGLAWQNCLAAIAAPHQATATVKLQARLLLVRSVTLETGASQNRANVAKEVRGRSIGPDLPGTYDPSQAHAKGRRDAEHRSASDPSGTPFGRALCR